MTGVKTLLTSEVTEVLQMFQYLGWQSTSISVDTLLMSCHHLNIEWMLTHSYMHDTRCEVRTTGSKL